MKTFRGIVFAIIVLLLVLFSFQNVEELRKSVDFQLNLYVLDLSPGAIPLYSALLILFFAGLLISGIAGWAQRIRLRGQCKRLNRLLQEKDQELNSLRNLPVLEERQAEPVGQTPQT